MNVLYPAGTHTLTKYEEYDLVQKCQVHVVTGIGGITFSYTSDNWGSISQGSIQQIVINNTLAITPKMTRPLIDFATILENLDSSKREFQNITQWIGQGIELSMNNSDLKSLFVRGSTASILCWAIDLDGLYNPDKTWRGITVAVAAISHYVLNQKDGNSNALCEYRGINGPGILIAPNWISAVFGCHVGY
ncbi:UNVERIFIED_CONTAM: hypothetical protein HDU68_012493 [Siphonaria sp. JEL0065]|nr:hypothetical protein HDU68_012493 [Siphonaria sp. JEL0065]